MKAAATSKGERPFFTVPSLTAGQDRRKGKREREKERASTLHALTMHNAREKREKCRYGLIHSEDWE